MKVKDPTHWDVIIDGMIGVTNEPGGTARAQPAGAPYKIAGKTGTAQVFSVGTEREVQREGRSRERLRDHALFIAFAPADAPKTRGRGARRERQARQQRRRADRAQGLRRVPAAAGRAASNAC